VFVIRRFVMFGAFAVAMTIGATPAQTTLDTRQPSVRNFIERMNEEHGFAKDELDAVLGRAEIQQTVLDAMQRPAERALLWHEYRTRFITPQRIAEGLAFWQEHRELLEQIARDRGVAPEYLVAILGVETSYGRITGRYRVIDALSTLAFEYPPRSSFFVGELEQFLLLTREEASDPFTVLGSYAGAMGPPQFMPGSVRQYAVDQDGDGQRNLRDDWADILGSIANYFVVHGWQNGQPVVAEAAIDQQRARDLDPRVLSLNESVGSLRDKGVIFDTALPASSPALLIAADDSDAVRFRVGFRNFYVITRYNHSPLYAMAVHDLATELAARIRSNDTVGDAPG
jgi:membrane-bound lytic murein transglycosylase B